MERLDDFWEAMRGRIKEAIEFRSTLSEETDRGCALMAASYLDSHLETLLRNRLVADQNVADSLFRPDGPLGSFAARIDCAYMLGVVGERAQKDLHLVRKIRNAFGHDPKPTSFLQSEIASRCRELAYTNLELDAAPRHRFTNTVLGLAAVLHVRQAKSEHIKPAADHVPDAEMRLASRKMGERIAQAIFGEQKIVSKE